MNKLNAVGLLAVVISGVSALKASGNGFRLADQDAFATARGEAFVATADNPSAVYYNPAGITQLEGNNLRSGIYGIYYDPTFTPSPPANTTTFHNGNKFAEIPQFFYTYTPKDSPLSLGLGVYSPYGGSISWPQNTGFRTVATKGQLTYFTFNPVVALKLAPNFSIAGGLMANYAKMDLEQGLRPFVQPPNFFIFTGDGWSVGYNLGLLWQPHEKVSVGATFRSTASFTLTGHTEFEQASAHVPDTRVGAQTDFEFPLTTIAGISYRPTPRWNVEFDADFTDWTSFGTTTIRQQQEPPLGGTQNIPVTLKWQSSWMYELGATRYFDSGWHVSAGYVFDENSVPDAFYTPLAADMNRHFFSVGTGFKARRLSFDVAYQFGYGPAHTVTGSTAPSQAGVNNNQNADGTYDFISHAVLLTVGLHF